jgi:hypothetical protein
VAKHGFARDPIRLARMVNKVEKLKANHDKKHDPHGLVPWVKKVVRLPRASR